MEFHGGDKHMKFSMQTPWIYILQHSRLVGRPILSLDDDPGPWWQLNANPQWIIITLWPRIAFATLGGTVGQLKCQVVSQELPRTELTANSNSVLMQILEQVRWAVSIARIVIVVLVVTLLFRPL